MIACVDVDYREQGASAACVLFESWTDAWPMSEVVVSIKEVEAYQSGQFFRRELPCLLAVLQAVNTRPTIVIVDGYVWLGDEHAPGLGAHLYEALDRQSAVIGVAKTRFLHTAAFLEIRRGQSLTPLYVTAVGIDLAEAARHVQDMHGAFRLPTLLKRVDQLCRGVIVAAQHREAPSVVQPDVWNCRPC